MDSCNTTFAQLGVDLGERVPAAARGLRDLRGAAARPVARRGGQQRSAPGLVRPEQAVVRARRHRPGRCRHDSAADGVGLGCGRQRRHGDAAARGRGDPRRRGQAALHDRPRRPGRSRCRPPRRRRSGTSWSRSCSGAPGPRRRSRASPWRARPVPPRRVTPVSPTPGSSSFAPAEAPQYAVAVIVERGGSMGVGGDRRPGRRTHRGSRPEVPAQQVTRASHLGVRSPASQELPPVPGCEPPRQIALPRSHGLPFDSLRGPLRDRQ